MFLPLALLLAASSDNLQGVAVRLQSECQCQLGVAAERVEGNARAFEFGERAYPTASTYKLPIAIAFLLRFGLDEPVRVLPVDITHGVSRIAEEMPHGGISRASRLK